MCRTDPPNGDSSGTTLGVPSEALLHQHNACSTHRFPRYARSCGESSVDANKEAGVLRHRLLKVAATYSPTTQCSTIGDAVSLSLPCALAPLRSAVSRLCPLSLPRPRAAGAHSPHPTPSATADTARASEAGLTTPELRLYRPGHKRYGLSQKENIGLSIFRATAKKSLVIEQGQRCHTPAHIIIIRA